MAPRESAASTAIEYGTGMPYANKTEHYAEWVSQTYYIKCVDKEGNQPLPTECSIIIRPYEFD